MVERRKIKNESGTGGNQKKRTKKAMKYPQGMKTVMSILADQDKKNQEFIAALNSQSPTDTTVVKFVPPSPAPTPDTTNVGYIHFSFPATILKFQSIFNNGSACKQS